MSNINLVIEAALEATADLGRDVLGLEVTSSHLSLPPFAVGRELVSVALVNECTAMQVGIAADRAVYTELVRPMLGMGPDEVPSQQDVIDAISEAVNIIAGNLKTRIDSTFRSLKLGLPFVTVDNPTDRHAKWVEFIRKPLLIGGHGADLIVIVKEGQC